MIGRAGAKIHVPIINYFEQSIAQIVDVERARLIALRRDCSALVLVGNSLGCLIAAKLHDVADHLVFAGPPFHFAPGPAKFSRDGIGPFVREMYHNQNSLIGHEALIADAETQVERLFSNRRMLLKIREMKLAAQSFVSSDILAPCQHKTHCLIGDHDQTTPEPAFRAFMSKTAPAAAISVLADCGHALPIEQPAAVATAVLDALQECRNKTTA